MTENVHDPRQALGAQLRELRRRAGLTGRELARLCGWHESKVSKLELARISPSDNDIRAYCEHTRASDQLAGLLTTLHHIDTAHLEWRRLLSTGTQRGQQKAMAREADASIIRGYQTQIIPGLLQTAGYASALLAKLIEFYGLPDDLEAGVATRMQRQRILSQRGRRFHFLIHEQALYSTVGTDAVMRGQLDRLLAAIGTPRVTIGIVPATAEVLMLSTSFVMFDNRGVIVEGIGAELHITQAKELAAYGRAFDLLARQAVTGVPARAIIESARARRAAAPPRDKA